MNYKLLKQVEHEPLQRTIQRASSDLDDQSLNRQLEVLRKTPPRDAAAAMRGRNAFLAEAAAIRDELEYKRRRGFIAWLSRSIKQRINLGRNKNKPNASPGPLPAPARLIYAPLIPVVVTALVSAAVIATAQSSLPHQPLYSIKLWSEDVQLLLTTDPSHRLDLLIAFANRRTAELEALRQRQELPSSQFMQRFRDQVDEALRLVMGQANPDAGDDGANVAVLKQLRATAAAPVLVVAPTRGTPNATATPAPTAVSVAAPGGTPTALPLNSQSPSHGTAVLAPYRAEMQTSDAAVEWPTPLPTPTRSVPVIGGPIDAQPTAAPAEKTQGAVPMADSPSGTGISPTPAVVDTVHIAPVPPLVPTPVIVPPTPTPVVIQPTATPVIVPPTATPVVIQPTATPVLVPPTPTPVVIQPTATPVLVPPTPTPVVIQPTATPVIVPPTPTPMIFQPTPTPVVVPPTPTPMVPTLPPLLPTAMNPKPPVAPLEPILPPVLPVDTPAAPVPPVVPTILVPAPILSMGTPEAMPTPDGSAQLTVSPTPDGSAQVAVSPTPGVTSGHDQQRGLPGDQ